MIPAVAHVLGGLAEVLNELGTELRRANQTSESTIMLGGADVELEFAAEASAEGGVSFWVVNTGASGTYTRTARLPLTSTPASRSSGSASRARTIPSGW